MDVNQLEKIKFKIRKAQKKDIHSIYKLGKRVHELDFSKKHPFHDTKEINQFISTPKETILLVVEINNEIAGFILAKILSHSWCLLDSLAVEYKYRKHGIGTHLLHALYKELKKRKVHYVQILEEIHHKQTRKFWKEKGFKETKVFVWAERNI